MPPLDSLPGDQRAVIQLVLGRGRSYDQIAGMLRIKPDAVRDRAVAALDALGPQTAVDPEHRAMITDYLLGQLPEPVVATARDLLARSAPARAWARVVSAELSPVASGALPEIPAQATEGGAAAVAAADESAAGPFPIAAESADMPRTPPEPVGVPRPDVTGAGAGSGGPGGDGGPGGPSRRSSRLGGAILIGVAVAVVIAVVLVLTLSGGSGNHHGPAAASRSTTSTTTATTPSSTSSSTTTSTTTGTHVIAQVNLTPPGGTGSKAAGIAQIVSEGSADGVAIAADNIPPNSTNPPNAYAVWLYNTPADAQILGFVNPGVGSNGRLSTAGGLPSNAAHYKYLIITLETTAKPKRPGKVVLEGTLTGL